MSHGDADSGQMQYDLEDAQARLAALDRAIAAYDVAREELTRAKGAVRRAQRRATETRWEVERLMSDQRRRAATPPPKGGGG